MLALADGLEGEELAERLGISRNTVQDRVRRLRIVLGCPAPFPLGELVARGYETGAVPSPARTAEETPGLNRTEAALVPHAAAGMAFAAMAERTGIPPQVVRTTVYALRERTGAVNGPHLVKRLRELGLVTPAGARTE
nr:AsnC family protein [Streptomyces sp. SID4919]